MAVTNAGLLPRKVPLCSPGPQTSSSRLEQRQCHRQTVAADRLRQRDDVGRDAGDLEGEERAGAAAAHLDVVDDQQDVASLAQIGERAQPFGAGDVDAAFALHGLDDDRGGAVEAAAGVVEHALEPLEVLGDSVEVVVERHRGGVHQRDAGTGALHGVAGDRQRAERHAVEGVGEVDDRLAPGDLAGQLQCGLDRVGAGRAGELDLVVEPARLEDVLLERLAGSRRLATVDMSRPWVMPSLMM